MKIEGGRSIGPSGGAKRPGAAAAPGFSPQTDEPQRASATTPTSAITPLDALLALQGDEPGQRRARQTRRGQDALDTLEKLAAGLLTGRAPASIRADLETLRRGAEETGEPGLDAVLQEIDIRLAVEAAKLDRMSGRA